jgi:hypothetical protein
LTFQKRRTLCIGLDSKRVLFAVDLDYEFPRWAREVCEVRADRMLPPKLVTIESMGT